MSGTRVGSLGSPLLALGCAAALTATSLASPAFVVSVQRIAAELKLVADQVGFIMGGTGLSDPTTDPTYIPGVEGLYLNPSSPLFDGQLLFPAAYQGLTTPEEFCPITACPPGGLTFGDSVSQGVDNMNSSVIPALQHGDDVTTFGYSQSGTVASNFLNALLANPQGADLDNLHSVIIGDPNSPIGGILDRFQFPDSITGQMQHVPFLNIPLGYAPTPTEGYGDSVIYTGEYDGWANEPQDPVTGLLALINALIGIETVHGFYPAYTADQLATAINVGTVGNTQMDFIPENLPILQFLYNTDSTAGQFFADAINPWLRLVIDWSYGNAGDPGDNLVGLPGINNAGGSGVDGMYVLAPGLNADGANIAASPYEASVGVAGGPWAMTPYGELWQSTLPDTTPSGLEGLFSTTVADSGIAGIFMKMDPLQLIAGVQNAFIQSVVGPWADVAAGNSATIPDGTLNVINEITQALRFVTGYDLVNGLDQLLLGGAQSLGLDGIVNDLFDGPLIPGQPIIDVVGLGFDLFNVFGA